MRTHAGRTTRGLVLRTAGAAVGLVLLAGCAGTSGDEPTASASPEPTATTPAASPTPTVTDTAAPTSSPVAGDAPTNGPVAVTAPASGASVPGPEVQVTGTGTAFEGTLLWELVAVDSGEVGPQGFTTGGANGEIGPFAFTATVPPGTWTLHVWEPGMGEDDTGGDRRNEATVTFTVS